MHDTDDSSFYVYEVPRDRRMPRPMSEQAASAFLYGIPTDAEWLRGHREIRGLIRLIAGKAGELPEPGSLGAYNLMAKAIVRDAVIPKALQTKASKRRPVTECWHG